LITEEYTEFAVKCSTQRGGVVVLLCKNGGMSAKRLRFSVTSTAFELLSSTATFANSSPVVVVVYPHGDDAVDNQFFDELEQLSAYSPLSCRHHL